MLRDITSWQSIRSGMKHEDDMARRDAEAYHQLIHGDRAGKPQGDADEMGDNIFLGDYQITQHLPQSPQPQQSSGLLSKALLGAGLIATGAGAAYGVPLVLDALRPAPVVVPAPETKPDPVREVYDFDVGQPYFGKPGDNT